MERRNDLIDGWRGISVSLVIIGHFMSFRLSGGTIPLRQLFSEHLYDPLLIFQNLCFRIGQYVTQPLAILGVDVFFVISGFLITSLLIREEAKNGSISISAFYVRRISRIMPAFYTLLLITFVLGNSGIIRLGDEAVIRSALYTCNFSIGKCSWWLAHTWSLSAEEQFYLVWPLMFLFGRKARRCVIVLTASLMPILAVKYSVFSSFIYISLGAAVASFASVRQSINKIATKEVITACILVLLSVPFMPPTHLASFIVTITPALVCMVLFGTISGRGPLFPIVSMGMFQKIGLLSYSLYLWQQMSLAPIEWWGAETGANLFFHKHWSTALLFIFPALLSYFVIERPLIAFGHRWSKKIIQQDKLGTVRLSSVFSTGEAT